MKLIKLGGLPYWQDDNFNIWNAREYNETQAYKNSLTLISCYYCMDCYSSSNLVRCVGCNKCSNLADCHFCVVCNSSSFLFNCKGCNNCYGLTSQYDLSNITRNDYLFNGDRADNGNL